MIGAALRGQVRDRAGDRCEYCRLPQSAAPFLTFPVEHIEATQHIRDDSLSNLCLACQHCNLNKGPNLATLDSISRELIRLFHPREQDWDEHFRFAGPSIEGITPAGKATVRLLKMNSEDQIEIRSALMRRGES